MKEHSQDVSPSPRADTAAPHVAHTPGPWKLAKPATADSFVYERRRPHGEASHYQATVMSGFNDVICRLDFGYGMSADEANAHVIAAAPELLREVKWLVGVVKDLRADMDFGFDDFQLQKIEALIAKAEGRSVGSHGTAVLSEASGSTTSEAQK